MMTDLSIVTKILGAIAGSLFFAKGFAIAVLKKYRLANWPYRTRISQQRAWWIGVLNLLVGSALLWWSFTKDLVSMMLAAFLLLAMLFLLPWHLDIRQGYREQERDQKLPGE